jgi:hypothetical protein
MKYVLDPKLEPGVWKIMELSANQNTTSRQNTIKSALNSHAFHENGRLHVAENVS